MYQVKVNEKYNFQIDKAEDGLLINNAPLNADIVKISESSFHIISQFKSYNAEVVSFDNASKTAEIKVNGNLYCVASKDQFDLLLDKLGLSSLNAVKVSEIKAPMPGMVLKVFTTEGMAVSKGDNLFILEAMKMENIIKAPADVLVKTLKIKPGDKVEKGQVLMMF